MPLTKSTTISKTVRVGKFVGVGPLVVQTQRGEQKMWHGDHVIEFDYTRAARPGELGFVANPGPKDPQALVKKTSSVVVTEDCAKALGIFLTETVEEEQLRVERELAEKKQRDQEAAEKKLADEEAARLAAATKAPTA